VDILVGKEVVSVCAVQALYRGLIHILKTQSRSGICWECECECMVFLREGNFFEKFRKIQVVRGKLGVCVLLSCGMVVSAMV